MKKKSILILILLTLTMTGCKSTNNQQTNSNIDTTTSQEEVSNKDDKIENTTSETVQQTAQSSVEFSDYPNKILSLGFTKSYTSAHDHEYDYNKDGNKMATVRFLDDGYVCFFLSRETKLVKLTESYKNTIFNALKLALPTQYETAYNEAIALKKSDKDKTLNLDGKKVELSYGSDTNKIIIYF